jgi:SAM-dependent methyltransferase
MRVIDRLRFYWGVMSDDMVNCAQVDYEWFRSIIATLEPYVGSVKGKTILDVGCGRRYPLALLLHNFGNKVVGVDPRYIGINTPCIVRWWKALRADGLEAFGRAVIYTIAMKNRTYYSTLRRLCDFPLNTDGIEIEHTNLAHLPFPDETFDIMVSVDFFEHMPNVSETISELKRVMKSGGVIYIHIHIFSGLSGGHQHDWEDPRKIPPWDHLRQRKHKVPIYLNKLRKGELLSILGANFEILEVKDYIIEQARELLTNEIRAELSEYSEEELLLRGSSILARKAR